MQHRGTQTIETNRLILRRFVPEDAQAAFRNWMRDPAVTEFLTWDPHPDPEHTGELLRKWCAEYEKRDYYQWAIELKEIGEPIGSISVVKQDEKTEMAHIGYCIGKPWWHRGYTSEALAAVIDFLFREVGVNRIETQHDPANPHSGGVMRKCGMQYEGTLRQAIRSNRGITDAAIYSILANEYEGAKQG